MTYQGKLLEKGTMWLSGIRKAKFSCKKDIYIIPSRKLIHSFNKITITLRLENLLLRNWSQQMFFTVTKLQKMLAFACRSAAKKPHLQQSTLVNTCFVNMKGSCSLVVSQLFTLMGKVLGWWQWRNALVAGYGQRKTMRLITWNRT